MGDTFYVDRAAAWYCYATDSWKPLSAPDLNFGDATRYLRADWTWQTIAGGAGAWGDITGTLANQTDLQTALDGKEPSGAHSGIGACAANQWASTLNDASAPGCTQPGFSNLSGSATDAQVPNTITVDLASAATALVADPADCVTATHFAVGVAASGAANCEAISGADLPAPGATTKGGVEAETCSGTDKISAINTDGTVTCSTDATAGGGPTTLVSSATQSDAVIATYTAITGLSFTAAASTNYLIDCYIIYTSTTATTGINFAWDTPASPTKILMTGHTKTVATGANEGFSQNSDNVGTNTSAAVITVEHLAYLSTLFRNGTTSAAMSLGFTPEAATSVSVIAGSVCQYRTFS